MKMRPRSQLCSSPNVMQMRAQNDAIINIRIEVYIYMCVKGFVCMILNNNPIDIFCECRKMSSDCNIRLDGICMLHDKLYIYIYIAALGTLRFGKTIHTLASWTHLPQLRPLSRTRETSGTASRGPHNSRPGSCRDTRRTYVAYWRDCSGAPVCCWRTRRWPSCYRRWWLLKTNIYTHTHSLVKSIMQQYIRNNGIKIMYGLENMCISYLD